MKIVIVGAGAIGSLFGALLSRGGHEVVFVEIRPEAVEAINARGIGLMEYQAIDPAALSYIPARAVTEAAAVDACDLILLAVKAFDTLTAMASIAHLITRDSPVISLQTALGTLELMERVERRRNIVGGFTFLGGMALGPGRVRHGGLGVTYIGELDGSLTPRVQRIGEIFNGCGIETRIVHEIMARLWGKVIVYAAINPVSTLLQVKNGRLLEKMEAISLMKRLIDEGRAVAKARQVDLDHEDLYELLFESCRHTAENVSSMLQDLISGRRTEIDYLNGILSRYGAELGVAVTTHQTMIELVRLLEKWGLHRD